MTDYNTMTAAQCADWLAERDGWVKTLANGATERDGDDGYFWAKGGKWQWDHPFALTLDAAAAALREPWGWGRVLWWKTSIRAVIYHATTCKKIMTEGHDELTARYRAAVAARMEEDNAK